MASQKLGSPQTTKFSIGTAELRIGPLNQVMKLKQEHSVGLVDSVTAEVNQQSVDLEGGFPKVLVDTAIISQQASLTAVLREYSRRNINVMLGNSIEDASPADVASITVGPHLADATEITVDDGTGFGSAGSVVVVYGATDSTLAEVSVCRCTSMAADVITLDTDTPLLFDYAAGSHVYLANHLSIGGITQTNYFTSQLLQVEHTTGRPVGYNFWKGSIGAGMTFATNAEDFASTDFNVKLLQPAAEEYDTVGTPLYAARDLIIENPTGMYFGGGD